MIFGEGGGICFLGMDELSEMGDSYMTDMQG